MATVMGEKDSLREVATQQKERIEELVHQLDDCHAALTRLSDDLKVRLHRIWRPI
jgi:hypothetical protein